MSYPHHTVIIVAGPTAVGKTALAIQLAQHFQTEIISADSRQCFREMNIGVAKPSAEELSLVKHHFINSHSITNEVNAHTFETYALEKVAGLFASRSVVVVTGGTGLYIKAFCEGMDEMPVVPPAIRQQVIVNYSNNGLAWLQAEIRRADPLFWAGAEQQNPQRLMRALEVITATGKSITAYRQGRKAGRPFQVIKTALELPKEILHNNIHQRVDQMMHAGLEAEVRALAPLRHLNALQTVGYRELFDYIDGNTTWADAVEQIKINTRQYAKRQMTWFKKDPEFQWFHPADLEGLLNYVSPSITSGE